MSVVLPALWEIALVEPLSRISMGTGAIKRLRVYRVEGTSMRPLLQPGDLILVRPVGDENERLPVGALGVWERGHSYVVHRILGVGRDGCVAKGDQEWGYVEFWPRRSFQGTVIARVRRGRVANLNSLRHAIPAFVTAIMGRAVVWIRNQFGARSQTLRGRMAERFGALLCRLAVWCTRVECGLLDSVR